MKSLNRDHFEKLTTQISAQEKTAAKALAKSKGMTFQGWLGQLVKAALKQAEQEASNG